jgi:hypothetical protein
MMMGGAFVLGLNFFKVYDLLNQFFERILFWNEKLTFSSKLKISVNQNTTKTRRKFHIQFSQQI